MQQSDTDDVAVNVAAPTNPLDYAPPPPDARDARRRAIGGWLAGPMLAIGVICTLSTVFLAIDAMKGGDLFRRQHDFPEWFIPFSLAVTFNFFGLRWLLRAPRGKRIWW